MNSLVLTTLECGFKPRGRQVGEESVEQLYAEAHYCSLRGLWKKCSDFIVEMSLFHLYAC